jgi:demethoxyubiquinone hydroxylase (CLK1/Coq7/Cat5 family)
MNKDRAKDSFIAHIAEVVEKHGDAVLKEVKNKDEEVKE